MYRPDSASAHRENARYARLPVQPCLLIPHNIYNLKYSLFVKVVTIVIVVTIAGHVLSHVSRISVLGDLRDEDVVLDPNAVVVYWMRDI